VFTVRRKNRITFRTGQAKPDAPLARSILAMMRGGRKIAKVAMARKPAVRLYWMWRKGWDYEQWKKFGSYVGQPGYRDGVR
jgi:transposase